ncbi:MAG: HD domain-containing protein [Prevotella sp.]|nr:HD domain-containing protein [Prevotella sp.]
MNYEAIIDKYYPEDDALRRLLLKHSRQVADRCLLVARRHPELPLDVAFLEEAAMLHDIGIRWCHAPGIFCQGTEHYIRHGLIGAELLRREGLERHARVCERHTGTGITQEQIARQQLPLPLADYVPETLEEQLVCYADKFYSKSRPDRELTVEQAAQSLAKFGAEGVEKFLHWAKMFE